MTENPTPPTFTPPTSAPPTLPYAPQPLTAPARWPTVLGILALVIGLLGLLSSLWIGLSFFWFGPYAGLATRMTASGPAVPVTALVNMMQDFRGWYLVNGFSGAAVAVLLIAGGAGLLNRRRAARPALLAWAVLRLILGVWYAFVAYRYQQAFFGAFASAVPAGAPLPMSQTIAGATGCVTLLWSWVPAIFVLVWFTRPRVTAEIATWR